jgi:hypothetical protein
MDRVTIRATADEWKRIDERAGKAGMKNVGEFLTACIAAPDPKSEEEKVWERLSKEQVEELLTKMDQIIFEFAQLSHPITSVSGIPPYDKKQLSLRDAIEELHRLTNEVIPSDIKEDTKNEPKDPS